MKKLLAIALIVALVALCLAGCAAKPTVTPTAEPTAEPEPAGNADQEAADAVAALIDAIYVQERTDETDAQCAAAKAAWDALTDAQKELVEGEEADPDYFGRDTGDASKDDPLNADGIGENELLVVSFGTSFNDSRATDIGGIEKALQAAFPDWSVRRAFTAQIIINHVQARDGEFIDNMEQALERAVANGVKNLVIQPTHLMHGAEYDELCEAAEAYRDKFESLVISEPLLGEVGADASAVNEDKERVAVAVTAAAVASAGFDSLDAAADAGVAFVFMGHGTSHRAAVTYSQMQTQMNNLGYKNVFIGTVEGEPEETACDAVIEAVKAAGYDKVILRPLMVVAGDHANNDMAGDDEDSWKSMFVASGAFTSVECQIEGLGRIEAVEALYVEHTAAVLGDPDQEAADAVAALIDAIYVQERTDETDAQCAAAKAAWDALTDAQKELVEGEEADPDYFGRDTGDASLDDPLNADGIGENELLVVSFGTSFNGSRAEDIGGIEKALQEAFPDWTVRRAFTAQIIINHVQARDGEFIDNMDQALERAVANGVKNLVIQPTHLMHGAEYDELKAAADAYADKFDNLVISEPLLGEVGADGSEVNADKEAVAKAVVDAAVAEAGFDSLENAANVGVAFVFMGHGTSHRAKVTYTQMQTQMDNLGYKNVFIGTVEGEPEETSCEAVIEAVHAAGYDKVVLRPLMVVAGDHANNDMAGDDEDSWKSQFEDAGLFAGIECQISGLGRIPAVQALYVEHAKAAIAFVKINL
jgi:cobalamin biosynthesis Co2+ chelatase CbiK